MKQTKKLLALVLALMMAFSLMAVTAAAAGAEEHEHVCSEETLQPRRPKAWCNPCGVEMNQVGSHPEGTVTYLDFECPICRDTRSLPL